MINQLFVKSATLLCSHIMNLQYSSYKAGRGDKLHENEDFLCQNMLFCSPTEDKDVCGSPVDRGGMQAQTKDTLNVS